jgi:hypothetical protein
VNGFNWLLDRPVFLERAYLLTEWALRKFEPALRRLGLRRIERLFIWGEVVTKVPLFGCKMCGVCNLRGTGMTCPMLCPKQMRNGPCGGVRENGHCEIDSEMQCVWIPGWERADKMRWYGERVAIVHPPLDWRLGGSSAWINFLEDRECCAPPGWPDVSLPDPAITLGFKD